MTARVVRLPRGNPVKAALVVLEEMPPDDIDVFVATLLDRPYLREDNDGK